MLQIYLDLGADGYSFEPLVAFGANAADPHHSPDDTVVKPGDCVLFDVGCIKDGYCSDMTVPSISRLSAMHTEKYMRPPKHPTRLLSQRSVQAYRYTSLTLQPET